MKRTVISLVVLITLFIIQDNVLYAQVKKGKPTKSKELLKCEKVSDSLIVVIQNLEAEISDIKGKNEGLSKENTDFLKQIESVKFLTVTNIKVENSPEGKTELTNKAKSVSKTTVLFEFMPNSIVPTGKKTVNVVLLDSKGKVVSPTNKKFKPISGNEDIACSAEMQVDYKEKAEKIKIGISHPKKLIPGKYKVEIYTNGYLSGRSDFVLE
ncbi:MAG: hypothetical protein CVU05_11765 [Bacteroidetes bacterium HGW-Bacteroidetes-21]|jgi:TolA-binding protein|nr:MAG: hypothetical protein CVU05_11765 [Bacteroidetes bacterium HGW-Bacteroidetes-21]